MSDQGDKKTKKEALGIALGDASQSTIDRFSAAEQEYVKAYIGSTRSDGRHVKGLHDIAASKVNPEFEYQNKAQQAGFSSEIMQVAEENAKNIIQGNPERVLRTDDIVGRVNDQKVDIMTIDAKGRQVQAAQMKVKVIKDLKQLDQESKQLLNEAERMRQSGDIKKAVKFEEEAHRNVSKVENYQQYYDSEIRDFANKLSGKDWAKYREDGSEILVAKNQYEPLKKALQHKQDKLAKQAQECRNNGDVEQAKQLEQRSVDAKKTAEALRPSNRTDQQHLDTRTQPLIETSNLILDTAFSAGTKYAVQAAKATALISGVQNCKAVLDGDKEFLEAFLDTSKDVGKSAAYTCVTATGGSLVKTGLDSLAEKVVVKGGEKALTKVGSNALKVAGSNIGMIISTSIEVGKSLDRYFNDEINGQELVVELGEKGTGIVSSVALGEGGAFIGTFIGGVVGTLIAGPAGTLAGAEIGLFVGSVVGGMVGYMAGTQLYQAVMQLLQQPGIEETKRRRMVQFASVAYEAMHKERLELEELTKKHYQERHEMFRTCFIAMDQAVLDNDTVAISRQLETVAQAFSGSLKLKNQEEFDTFMLDRTQTLVF